MNNLITKFEHNLLKKDELSSEEFQELLAINMEGKFFRESDKGIKLTQYVGVIFLSSGRIIEILPKIYEDRKTNEFEHARKFLTILFYEFLGLARSTLSGGELTSIKLDFKVPFFEILTLLILSYIEKRIIQPGIYKHYLRNHITSRSLNGKLLLSQTLLKFPFQKDRFVIEKEVLTPNVAVNRVLVNLSEFTMRQFKSSKIRNLAGKILLYLQSLGIESSQNIQKDLMGIKLNRMNIHYHPVIQFARLLFSGESIAGSKGVPFIFLYDMNKLFERFVAASLPECLYQESEEIDRDFILRPDFLFPIGNRKYAVIDTKWKFPINLPMSGISTCDRFQVISYMYLLSERENWKIPLGILLYPDLSRLFPTEIKIWNLSNAKKLIALGLGLQKLFQEGFFSTSRTLEEDIVLLKQWINGEIQNIIANYLS